jgi:hypothetical protein
MSSWLQTKQRRTPNMLPLRRYSGVYGNVDSVNQREKELK